MSVTQLCTYQWTCDGCGRPVIVQAPINNRPEGWRTVQSHGWGMTNYTKDLDLCNDCAATPEKFV